VAILVTNYAFSGQDSDVYRGETRDVYTIGNHIISIATDRLSVFGHLFPDPIPHKGQVLNQLTYYFAQAVEDIVPQWIESMPDPNVSIGKHCQRFEINIVIRGALIGHAWRVYSSGVRIISGVEIPAGMSEYDVLDEPIITPSTKAQRGYEEDISATEIIEQGIMTEAQLERLSIIARQLFIRGKQLARERGFMLADTKYEFGLYNEEIYLIDEIHTPDNSRYFHIDEYEKYLQDKTVSPPQHFSKELVSQWLLEQGYSGLDDQIAPEMSQEFINRLSKLYIEIYEQLTAQRFVAPGTALNPQERIKNTIDASLKLVT
jgi:phosphoribosylaminoimidazole-succinocarboxamide synthase